MHDLESALKMPVVELLPMAPVEAPCDSCSSTLLELVRCSDSIEVPDFSRLIRRCIRWW